MAVERDITWNIRHFQGALRCDRNFDVVYRVFRICGREACMFFCRRLCQGRDHGEAAGIFSMGYRTRTCSGMPILSQSRVSPYCEVAISGGGGHHRGADLVWGMGGVRGWNGPVRADRPAHLSPADHLGAGPGQVLSGSRDGFVETMVFNAALIRRRIRSPRLCVEHLEVGETSRTDVAVCYFEGRADPELVNTVRGAHRPGQGGRFDHESGEPGGAAGPEAVVQSLPQVQVHGTAGRGGGPDPGRGCGGAGGQSPAAIILPTTLFDVMEEANDYYFRPSPAPTCGWSGFYHFSHYLPYPGVAPADPGAGTGPRVAGVYSDGGAGAGAPLSSSC